MGMSNFQRVQQWMVFARQWHIVDATYQDVDVLARLVARHLAGMQKPIYHDETDCGDHVVIYNCKHVAKTAFDWKRHHYFYHRMFGKSKRTFPSWAIQNFDPCRLMFMATYKALPTNPTRRVRIERLHLFPEDKIPDQVLKNVSNQLEQPQRAPKRSDEYTEEERARFPKLYTPKHTDIRLDYKLAHVDLKFNTENFED